MNIGEILAIASFAISTLAIVFTIGKNTQRLEITERDLNSLGGKVEEGFKDFDKRLDKLSTFAVRIDQRILNLEERRYGEDTAARMRE